MRKLLPTFLLTAGTVLFLFVLVALSSTFSIQDYSLTVIPITVSGWLLIVLGVLLYFAVSNRRNATALLLLHFLLGIILIPLPIFLSGKSGFFLLAPLVLLLPLSLLLGVLFAERRQSRWQLIQTEKMAAMGSLLAGLAHEINNPLTFIYSNIDILREYVAELKRSLADPEGKAEKIFSRINATVDTMDEGATRAQEIIKNLRHFSYPGKRDKEWMELNPLLDHSIALLAPKWKGRLRIIRRYEETPKIYGLPGELGQVFLNILANACDATPKRGVIRVRTWQEAGAAVTVAIRDSGIGIKKNHLTRIFDPFFTTKEQGEGTGLGLAICQQIVQKHQGKIEVKSEWGKGAEVRITLPIEASLRAREIEDAHEATIPARREV